MRLYITKNKTTSLRDKMSTNNTLRITSNKGVTADVEFLSSSRKTGLLNKIVHFIYKIAADIFSNYFEVIYTNANDKNYEYVIKKHNFTKYEKSNDLEAAQKGEFGTDGNFVDGHYFGTNHTVKKIEDLSLFSESKPTPALSQSQKIAFKSSVSSALHLAQELLNKSDQVAFKEIIPKTELTQLKDYLKEYEKMSPEDGISIEEGNLSTFEAIGKLLNTLEGALIHTTPRDVNTLSRKNTEINIAKQKMSGAIAELTEKIRLKSIELTDLEKVFEFEFETKADIENEIAPKAAALEDYTKLYDKIKSSLIAQVLENGDVFDEDVLSGINFVNDFERAVENNEDLSSYYTNLTEKGESLFATLEQVKRNIVDISKKLKVLNISLRDLEEKMERFSEDIEENKVEIASTQVELESLKQKRNPLVLEEKQLIATSESTKRELEAAEKQFQKDQLKVKSDFAFKILRFIPQQA